MNPPHIAPRTNKLSQLAKVILSKNSGPFEITFDVVFDDAKVYGRVKASDVITPALVRRMHGVTPADIVASSSARSPCAACANWAAAGAAVHRRAGPRHRGHRRGANIVGSCAARTLPMRAVFGHAGMTLRREEEVHAQGRVSPSPVLADLVETAPVHY